MAEVTDGMMAADSDARLTSYLPRLLLEWQRDTPDERYRAIEGTLVFTDLSGFTAISERLGKLGKLGAEELVEHLDATFSKLLDVAHAYGGSMLKFGGDALLIFFWGDDHVIRGVRAVADMQAAIRRIGRIQTSAGAATLRMSAGVHTGTFDFFLVGESHLELLVTGAATTTTVAMESAADAREVLLSPETAELLPARCIGTAKGPGLLLKRAPLAPMVELPEWPHGFDAGRFIPVSLLPHLREGEAEAGHRQITVSFLHASNADQILAQRGPHEAADRLHAFMAEVQARFDEYGVALLATDLYEDGPKFLACVGAPRTWGNDDERMLRAVRAIVDADHGIVVRAGINRGYGFAADLGPAHRRTYVAMGDVVNTAARIMSKAAPGQLLAVPAVVERSKTLFATREMPPFPAKGKALPIVALDVGRIEGTRTIGVDGTVPLLGRDQELEELRAALRASKAGQGAVIQIVAPPGVGKSRLVHELVAGATDVRLASVACHEYEAATPYFAAAALLRQVLELDGLDAESSVDQLTKRIAEAAPELEPWLPLIAIPLNLQIAATPESALLDPQFMKTRVNEAVRDLVASIVGQETWLWEIEDAHWMDTASAELLLAMATSLRELPVMLLTTRRPGEDGLQLAEPTREMTLAPLDPHSALELARTASGAALLPHDVATLANRAEGNPLFLLALVGAARETKDVEQLPATVDSLIASQIDQLPPKQKATLKDLSVLGTDFRVDLAQRLAPDLASWARSLNDFVEVDLAGGRARFRHALLQRVGYESLPYRRRRSLHGQVGLLIEESADEDDAEALSLHFHHARDRARAWKYSRIAAQRAEQKYVYSMAAEFHERAVEAGRAMVGLPSTELRSALNGLGDALRRSGQLARAAAAYRKARVGSPDPIAKARLLCQEAGIDVATGNLVSASRKCRMAWKAATAVRGPDGDVVRATVLNNRATIAYSKGRYELARELAGMSLELARASGDDALAALAQQQLFNSAVRLNAGDADAEGRSALAMARAVGDPRLEASTLSNLGIAAHLGCRWTEALRYYEAATEKAEESGYALLAAVQSNNAGEILSDQGRFGEARTHFERAIATAIAAGTWQAHGYQTQLGRLAAREGEFAEAQALLTEARAGLERVGLAQLVAETDAKLAENLLFEHRSEEALAMIRALLPRADGPLRVLLLRLEGYALSQLHDDDLALARLDESLEVAERIDLAYDAALAHQALATLSLNESERRRHAAEAEKVFSRLGVVATPPLPV